MITLKTSSHQPRYKFVVCHPSTRTEVKAFYTLKAARAFVDDMVIEYFPWGPNYLPIIKKESIGKYNQRKAAVKL